MAISTPVTRGGLRKQLEGLARGTGFLTRSGCVVFAARLASARSFRRRLIFFNALLTLKKAFPLVTRDRDVVQRALQKHREVLASPPSSVSSAPGITWAVKRMAAVRPILSQEVLRSTSCSAPGASLPTTQGITERDRFYTIHKDVLEKTTKVISRVVYEDIPRTDSRPIYRRWGNQYGSGITKKVLRNQAYTVMSRRPVTRWEEVEVERLVRKPTVVERPADVFAGSPYLDGLRLLKDKAQPLTWTPGVRLRLSLLGNFPDKACMRRAPGAGSVRSQFPFDRSVVFSKPLPIRPVPGVEVRPTDLIHRDYLSAVKDQLMRVASAAVGETGAEAIPIPDKGKVRVITKEHASAKCLVPIQTLVSLWLSGFRETSITRRPQTTDDILWIATDPDASPDSCFVSGDYESATDYMPLEYSRAFWIAIISVIPGLSDLEKQVIIGQFYARRISYPKGSGIPPLLQRRGQLMGNLLSFPALTGINLISFRSLFPYRRVLINGDDILFRATKPEFDKWVEHVQSYGLVINVRKTIFSPFVANINSATYHWVPERRAVIQIPRYPYHLATTLHPGGNVVLDCSVKESSIIKRFYPFHLNRRDTRPFFGETWRGGMGFTYAGFRPSKQERWLYLRFRAKYGRKPPCAIPRHLLQEPSSIDRVLVRTLGPYSDDSICRTGSSVSRPTFRIPEKLKSLPQEKVKEISQGKLIFPSLGKIDCGLAGSTGTLPIG
ncbi:RNA-dependent RNA polymerase [Hubei narna-like virus 13]|uniref:RNA-dependent RNA polymerase n=1 Tax=Hubei narna-like virus 13 TaxID=1922943 RepID=UPI00090C9E48|nr:RNA-dependent RNA polymerase [Hubei narna-like virus 13]APG77154.1 RNA-dependent RNA polymerase [Hubei narna-like virus 13]